MCCQSCGHTALSQIANEKNKLGWVFWHKQDEESLKERGLLHIAFGARRRSSLKVGQELVKQLMKQGLMVSWDWNKEARPEVQLT